jgi:hypothetical protein
LFTQSRNAPARIDPSPVRCCVEALALRARYLGDDAVGDVQQTAAPVHCASPERNWVPFLARVDAAEPLPLSTAILSILALCLGFWGIIFKIISLLLAA